MVALANEPDRTHRRREEGHRVGADREEGRVSEVEQAREADDDVETEREHDEERDRDGLRFPPQAEDVVDDRKEQRSADADDRSPHLPLARLAGRRVPPAEGRTPARWRLAFHAFSPVS